MTSLRTLRRVLTHEQARALIGDDVPEKQPTVTLPGIYTDEDTGAPVFAYLPMPSMVPELRSAVLGLNMGITRRATGVKNASRSFGMLPRRPHMKRETCMASILSSAQPGQHAVLVDLAGVFTDMMRGLLPAEAEHDHEYVEKILPEWRMGDDALWTSGVVNRSSTLPYHLDSANYPTWSAMPVVRRGMRGGYLDCPEYDLVCACRDGWVVFMVGQQLVHGVTPMRSITRDAYRYSVVYYALQGMKDCFTTAVEQRRARLKRTSREDGMGLPDDTIVITEEAAPRKRKRRRPDVYVISAGRDQNVPGMLSLLEDVNVTWVIPEEQRAEYAAAGAASVLLQPAARPGVTHARNLAITHAETAEAGVCVQLSDDLAAVKRLAPDGKATPYTAFEAIRDLKAALKSTGYALAGCSPTANAFYAKDRIHERAFIVGDFIAIRLRAGDPPVWFDETLPLKEDYDYTLQHIERHGGVARCDWLLPTFRHRTNPGGAVSYRTAELEQEAIRILKAKWPDNVHDNPRRPNEVLLRWPRVLA